MTSSKRRGRIPATPYHPNLAKKATEDFIRWDAKILEYQEMRDEAFVRMLKSGLTTYQIAKLVGVAEGSVRYWADSMRVKRRKVAGDPPNTIEQVFSQAAKKPGSVLFG